MNFQYRETPTGKAFHESDAFIKAIVGPYASGKSTAVAQDILIYALAQPPAPDGVRYSRWGVIRGSYPALVSTTRNTLLEVLPNGPGIGGITMGSAPLHGTLRFGLPDKTAVQLELTLVSVANEADTTKIRSSNWTGVWINEATEVEFAVLREVAGRVGRYPSAHMMSEGGGFAGILMDFNQPPAGHWLHGLLTNPVLELGNTRVTVDMFKQPPAAFKVEKDGKIDYEVNPEAENLENLRGGLDYYTNQIALALAEGRRDVVENNFCLLDVPVKAGKAVFPQFDSELHVAKNRLEPEARRPVVVGYDTSGINPAAVVLQMVQGKWRVLDEIIGEDTGLEAFMESALIPLMRQRYRECEVTISVDPADAKDAYTGLTPSTHLRRAGFRIFRPPTNKPAIRIRAVEKLLNLHQGGLLISPDCKILIQALNGDYHYRKLKMTGTLDVVHADKPEKNDASHIADALQYAALYIQREFADKTGQPDPKQEAFRRRYSEHAALRARIM